jgi:HPt (histidine-containing phosphotransfer) domain-containing protein
MSAIPAQLAGTKGKPHAMAIDAAAGVDRLMGDRDMYARVLARFRSDFAGAADAIGAAAAGGDHAGARRLAHTLKGAAALIEAPLLKRRTVALEQALRAPGNFEVELGLVRAELARVVGEIDQLAPGAAGAALQAGRASYDGDVAARLCELLDVGDGAATEFIVDERERLLAALGPARYADVAVAVGAYDFIKALRLLDDAGDKR